MGAGATAGRNENEQEYINKFVQESWQGKVDNLLSKLNEHPDVINMKETCYGVGEIIQRFTQILCRYCTLCFVKCWQ